MATHSDNSASLAGNEPLISIPLCTYNGARYLSAQLDSLFAQTYPAVEIVAVDDGSTDATVTILNDYAQRHPRMRVEINPVNLGFRRNFELALAQCRGDFIAPCDQDDVWLSEKLDLLYKAMGGCAMSYCDSALIDADGKLLGKAMSDIWVMKDLDDPMAFVMENSVSGHAMLFRRELLARALPMPEGFFHDWWLAAVAAANGGAVFSPHALVRYRQHSANVTDVLRARKTRSARTVEIKLTKWRDTGNRIRALAELNGPSSTSLARLGQLWSARYAQWFSWSLLLFAVRYRDSLWGLKRRSQWQRVRLPFRLLMGFRWRRMFSAADAPAP